MLSGFGFASGVVGVLGGIFSLIIIAATIFLGVYIYRDANKRNLNGTLWLIIILISWFAGAIIYFIIRDDESAVECPNCQTIVKGNNAFCPKCGTEVKR